MEQSAISSNIAKRGPAKQKRCAICHFQLTANAAPLYVERNSLWGAKASPRKKQFRDLKLSANASSITFNQGRNFLTKHLEASAQRGCLVCTAIHELLNAAVTHEHVGTNRDEKLQTSKESNKRMDHWSGQKAFSWKRLPWDILTSSWVEYHRPFEIIASKGERKAN